MSIEALLTNAQAGKFPPVCVLTGSERVSIERTIAALKKATLGDGPTGFNDDLFQGQGLSAQTVINASRTLPMMAASRFVLVRNADAMLNTEQDALCHYVAKPSPETCLILVAGKIDGRTKLAKVARDLGALHECEPPRPGDVPDLARKEARVRGHALSPEAADALSEALGPDVAGLSDALDRLSLFVGEARPIEAEHVAACVAHARTESIWSLVDAVSARDAATALTAASSLLADREPPLRILALVARQLRTVARMRSALAGGLRPQEAAQKAGAPPFKARDLAAAAQRFDEAQLSQAFRLVAEADLALKGSKVPDSRVLELMLLRLCRGRA